VFLIGALLRFFEMIQASLEEMSVEINVMSLQQMIRSHNAETQAGDLQCTYLNKPDAFTFANSKNGWQYDAAKHQLIYSVRSKRYFSSENVQKIVLELYCNKGAVFFKKTPFQWCHEKRLWGCADK
jgi:hypothetical protein